MWHPGTDTGPSDPYEGMEKQTIFASVPQLTGDAPSPNIGIPASKGNPSSYVRVAGSGNITSVLPVWQP